MEKEFVKYEQALALKELGFKKECFGYYDKDGDFYTVAVGKLLNAPLYQQAFRWFRNKHNIITQIIYCTEKLEHISPEEVGYYGIILLLKNKEDEKYLDHWYKTYEETEQACLDKLIEIVKNK